MSCKSKNTCCSNEKDFTTTYHPDDAVIKKTQSTLTFKNHLDHIKARIGLRRNEHLVIPGLYTLGSPDENSKVFVTANYTLSFDALRSALKGLDCFILVLDTHGINVWCAAGKGTFGTDELVNRINAVKLHEHVKHHKVILPQLGAPGIISFEVKERTGFKVEFGPVKASDLPEYLKSRKVDTEIRRVRFGVLDRAVLIPVEFRSPFMILMILLSLFFFGDLVNHYTIGGWLAAIFSGLVLFPLLLPWLPTKDFTAKGFQLGGLIAAVFGYLIFVDNPDVEIWRLSGHIIGSFLLWTSITAFLALNFTGSSTFASRSGVRKEIFTYGPVMAVMAVFGTTVLIVSNLV